MGCWEFKYCKNRENSVWKSLSSVSIEEALSSGELSVNNISRLDLTLCLASFKSKDSTEASFCYVAIYWNYESWRLANLLKSCVWRVEVVKMYYQPGPFLFLIFMDFFENISG